MGRRRQANGQFSLPLGTVDARNGLADVADYGNNRVQVFDLDGNFIDKWGSEGTKEGQFTHPSAIAIGHDGSVYVGEDEGGRIQHFDRNGRYLGQIGEPMMGNIYGIAIDADGSLLGNRGAAGSHPGFPADGSAMMRIGATGARGQAGISDRDCRHLRRRNPGGDRAGCLEGLPATPGPVSAGGSGPTGELIRFTIPALSGS